MLATLAQFDPNDLNTLTEAEAEGIMAGLAIYLVFVLIISIVMIVAMWQVFKKAGKPGWAAIIPIYNTIVLLEIVGRPIWWILLMFIPFVNLVIWVIVMVDLAKSFGKGVGYAIGLMLLAFIFLPMLGFGSSRYVGPAGAPGGAMPPPPAPPMA